MLVIRLNFGDLRYSSYHLNSEWLHFLSRLFRSIIEAIAELDEWNGLRLVTCKTLGETLNESEFIAIFVLVRNVHPAQAIPKDLIIYRTYVTDGHAYNGTKAYYLFSVKTWDRKNIFSWVQRVEKVVPTG